MGGMPGRRLLRSSLEKAHTVAVSFYVLPTISLRPPLTCAEPEEQDLFLAYWLMQMGDERDSLLVGTTWQAPHSFIALAADMT